jgi:hypothetical protein
VLPSVAEDVAELKYKGAHEGEVTRYKELATRRTELNKKVKGGGATKDDHLEVERVKTELAGIRQQIRDRYAAEHGREKEKSITGKKVSQGKVKDDVSESGKRARKDNRSGASRRAACCRYGGSERTLGTALDDAGWYQWWPSAPR